MELDAPDFRCSKRINSIIETKEQHSVSCQAEPKVRTCGVQWEDPWEAVETDHAYYAPLTGKRSTETQTGTDLERTFSEDLTEPACNFYTGLSRDGFSKLVATVSLAGPKKMMITTADQVLLTLMRLRLGLLYFDLAMRFGISVSQAGKVFREMVDVLYRIMQKIVVWLPIETICATMPQPFRQAGYENTTCIIDCTEVHMQRPKKLYARGQTYSSYKGGNTVKFLVAVAPSGFIMFVSGVYGGRASDKFIVEDSNFTDYLFPDQVVMADRGFALTNKMKEKGVTLNTPAFTRGRQQFPEAEATRSRRISSLRIHVERAINRIKCYRILKGTLPIHHKKLMNKIALVCAGLCNLKGPLIAPQALPNDQEEDPVR
ncbi:hypothetical protein MTO96_040981 [Rhipicephalus appendiculatus]